MLKKAGQLAELCRSAGPKIRTLDQEVGLSLASSVVNCVSSASQCLQTWILNFKKRSRWTISSDPLLVFNNSMFHEKKAP